MVNSNQPNALRSPIQLPDWRLRRVADILENGGYATRRRDGHLIQRTVHFLREAQRAVTNKSTKRIAREYAEIFTAFRLRASNNQLLLELKARTLAGQTDPEIAHALGLPRETIRTYLDLFLDIRHRLQAKPWIAHQVIGVPLADPPSVEQVMLLHAWQRGPGMIAPWMDYLVHCGEAHDVRTEIGRQRAWIDLLVDIQQLPGDEKTHRSLRKRWHLILGNVLKPAQPTTVQAAISRNRAEFLGGLPWNAPAERVSLDELLSEELARVSDLQETVEFARTA